MTTATAADLAALDVRDLSIQFGGIRALTDVSFDVPQSGFTAIIGPNGAGKTTLFNCVSGFYTGTGTIHSMGQPLDAMPRSERSRNGISRTFQTPILLDQSTVLQNIMLGTYSQTSSGVLANFFGLPRSRSDERQSRETAGRLIDIFGLQQHAHTETGGLPHRQRRLVEIARAVASNPRVLLLDEPAAGSHHSEAVAMIELVRAYCTREGIAVVLVEHNVRLVMEFAADIVVLHFGALLARGTPAQIQNDPAVIEAYLGGAA